MLKSDAPHFSNDNAAKTYGKIIRLFDNRNFQTLPTIAAMARICGCSETTVKNHFKKYSGKSYKKYYNGMRIEYIKNYLMLGKSAGWIVNNLHFSSVSYLSRFFKNNTGMTMQ